MKFVLYFLTGIAAVGAALCAITHLAALAGQKGPLGDHFLSLVGPGLFVIWLPAVLAAGRFSKDVPQKDLWKAMLRGCPPWMKYGLYGAFAYSFVNFALMWLRGGANLSAQETQRFFSGHILTFYFAAMAILYSAAALWDNDGVRRCSEGHAVGPLAKFCDQCGRPVPEIGGYNARS